MATIAGLAGITIAQPTVIGDTTTGIATNDGFVNALEYPGFSTGINSGFGDKIGANSELHIDSFSDAGAPFFGGELAIGIITGGTAIGTDYVVIYIDSETGGITSTADLNDNSDDGRAAVSGNGTGGGTADLYFAPGFAADYAIAINPGVPVAALYQIGSGSINFVRLLTIQTTDFGTEHIEITDLNLSDLGLASGDSFKYIATLINPSNAFRADEFHGVSNDTVFGGNIGANPFFLEPNDYNTFVSIRDDFLNTTHFVTNTDDAGAGSLRQTIADANPGDLIRFDLPINSTILLASPLTVDKTLTIDARSAPGLIIDGDNINGNVVEITGSITVVLDSLTIQNCRASGLRITDATVTLQSCTIRDNFTDDHGGGIFIDGDATVTIVNSTIHANNATQRGGAIATEDPGTANLTIVNSTISGNASFTALGGGIYFSSATRNLTVINCTITENEANVDGGGVKIDAAGTFTLKNTIIANNFASNENPDLDFSAVGTLDAIHNLIGAEDGHTLLDGIDGNLVGTNGDRIDPMLLSLDDNGGATMTHRLSAFSPARDAGDNASISALANTTSQHGGARIHNGTVDMGAFEAGRLVWNTTDTGAGSLRSRVEEGLEGDLALFHSTVNGTILLASGNIEIIADIAIIGNGTVTLDGNLTNGAFLNSTFRAALANLRFENARFESAVMLDSGADVTIDNCTFADNFFGGNGGAINCDTSTLTIRNSTFSNNEAGTSGGAIFSTDSTLAIHDSTFSSNTAGAHGGAINLNASTATAERSTFTGNSCTNVGGAILVDIASNLVVSDSTFSSNSATEGGALGTITVTSEFTATNCTFTANSSAQGAAFAVNDGQATLIHCTIVGNTDTSAFFGGISNFGTLTMRNTIVAQTIGAADVRNFGTITASNCLIGDGTSSGLIHGIDGNIVGDSVTPVDPMLGPLQNNGGSTQTRAPLANSPVIDMGDDGFSTAIDQRGISRPIGAAVDIGSVEFFKVVINEIVTDPQQDWSSNDFDGTVGAGPVDSADQWLEIFIPVSGLDLTDWTIDLDDATPSSGHLAANGAFVISRYVGAGSFTNTVAGDYLVLGTVNGDTMDDEITIILRDAAGNIVDQVTLGGVGNAPSGDSTNNFDEAVARIPNGEDTDDDAADFAQVPATPGSANRFPPTITNFATTATFGENTVNAAAQIIDDSVTFTDLDTPAFDGGSLRVDYSVGGSAQDQLSIANIGNGAGEIGVAGDTVSFGGVPIGLIDATDNGQNGAVLLVSINANATPAAVQALLEALSYANTSDAPTLNRTIRIVVNDGFIDGPAVTCQITVVAENDAPILTPQAPTLTGTDEDTTSQAFIVTGIIGGSIIDPDGAVPRGIAIIGTTGNGTWEFSIDNGANFNPVGVVSNISALLLRTNDFVRYVPDGENGETATFSYRAWDRTTGDFGDTADASVNGGDTAFSTATDTASIVVTDVNDAPELTPVSPTLTSTNENTTSAEFPIDVSGTVNDVDSGAEFGIAIVGTTGNGTWEFSIDNGANFNPVGAVSNANARLLRDIDFIRYVPDGMNGETATFTFRAWDRTTGTAGNTADTTTNGGTTAFSTATDTASLTVTDVNDAPILTPTSPPLTSTDEDTTSDEFLVGDIIDGNVDDVDNGAEFGIAIIGTTGNGTWEFSIDNGANFNPVGAVSGASALLLRDSDFIRYVPDGENGETATFTFRAWDRTTGTAGGTADATTNGGTTAFSTATDTASLTVTDVNDAPELTPTSPTLTSTDEDTTSNEFLVDDIIDGNVDDVDNGAEFGIAIISTTGNGTWEFSIDNGANFNPVGAVSGASALLLRDSDFIRYVPDGFNGETATFTFRAWDRTTGTAGGTADATTNGGTTAFSSDTDTASIVVTDINDAPEINGTNGTLNYTEGDSATIIDGTITVTDVDSANFNDGFLLVEYVNGATADDQLSVNNQGTGAGQIGVSGNTVSFGGTAIGTIDGSNNGQNGADLEIHLNTNATPAAVQALARQITFANTSSNPATADRELEFFVGDGDDMSTAYGVTITVVAVNDAPTVDVPSAQTTPLGVALEFSSGESNAITVDDVDADGNDIQLTLTATNGTLTLNGTAGLAFTVGTGTDDATMTFTGTLATINAALDGLIFTPTAGFSGSANLSVEANDLGNSGTGGAQTASDSVAITVTPGPDIDVQRPSGTSIPHTGTDTLPAIHADSVAHFTYTIANGGDEPLSNVAMSVANAVDCIVHLLVPPADTVPANGSTIAIVRIQPSASTFSFEVSIESNDPDEDPYEFTVQGTTIAGPEIEVYFAGLERQNGDTVAVGSLLAGSGTLLEFDIENVGGAALTAGASIGDEANCTVAISQALPGSINGGETLGLTVTPAAAGNFRFTLTLATNDADENPMILYVNGTAGASAQPVLRVGPLPGVWFASGSTVNVGLVTTSANTGFTFRLSNFGSDELTLSDAQITDENNVTASVDVQPPSAIDAGETDTFEFTVNPVADGSFSFTLTIPNSDPAAPNFLMAIHGTGSAAQAPRLRVWRFGGGQAITHHDTDTRGGVAVGDPLSVVYVLQNAGNDTLTDIGVMLHDMMNCSIIAPTLPPSTIAAHSFALLALTLTPEASGAFGVEVEITSNDPVVNPFTFMIESPGQLPQLVVRRGATVLTSGGTDDMGEQSASGGVFDVSYTIANEGTAPLILSGDVELIGLDGTDATVQLSGSTTIQPGQSVTVTIFASPNRKGPFSVTVRVESNDPTTPIFTLTISGTGKITGGGCGVGPSGHPDWLWLVLAVLPLLFLRRRLRHPSPAHGTVVN